MYEFPLGISVHVYTLQSVVIWYHDEVEEEIKW